MKKSAVINATEFHINLCGKLKQLLLFKFSTTYNSTELHDTLNKQKLQENESLEEYFLIMKQLYLHGNIKDFVLMQYICNIPDFTFRKSILYRCQSIIKFKQKLRIYEKLRLEYDSVKSYKHEGTKSKSRPESEAKNKNNPVKPNMHCYNCGRSILIMLIKIKLPFDFVVTVMAISYSNAIN